MPDGLADDIENGVVNPKDEFKVNGERILYKKKTRNSHSEHF